MKDQDLKSLRDFGRGFNGLLKKINKKEKEKKEEGVDSLTKVNVRYAFASVALFGLVFAFYGINVWTILMFFFSQSLYFFGRKTVTRAFQFSFGGIAVILSSGFLYNAFVEKTGLEDDLLSFKKNQVLKVGMDLENPAVDLQAKARDLIRQQALAAIKKYPDNFDTIMKYTAIIKRMDDSVYNSVHDKRVQQAPIQVGQQTLTDQSVKLKKDTLNIVQYKTRQIGDTAYYKFTLQENQITSNIVLTDANSNLYAWHIDFGNDVRVNSSNGQSETWLVGKINKPIYGSYINLSGVYGKGPVTVNLKVYPA